jgi:predicted metalloprotease
MGRRQSGTVEDRRGFSGRMAGGGIVGLITIVVALFLGVDPSVLVPDGLDPGVATSQPLTADPADDQHAQFVAVVLADTEDVWNRLFQQQLGRNYRDPTLVLFSETSQSGCGFASAASGPFYCPADEKVYIDLQFFQELQTSFQAAGDFAEAYVIAHEVGHHVQNQLGVLEQVQSRRGKGGRDEANEISVRAELQADFLAGVWAYHAQETKGILEPGDLEEALGAAAAVGDDRLQRRSQGYVVPDSFTHGTSEQRSRWFRKGFESGDLSRMMDLFKVDYRDL